MQLLFVQKQKQLPNQLLRQSFRYLQMTSAELQSELEEEALGNPMLDVQPPEWPAGDKTVRMEYSEYGGWKDNSENDAAEFFVTRPQMLSEYLLSQLGQMQIPDRRLFQLCVYLIGCLDTSGYMTIPLTELASEIDCSSAEIEQALFTIQLLDPAGVGARNLSECLLIQLAQSEYFCDTTVRMIKYGLSYLGRKDYAALSKLLQLPLHKVKEVAKVVQQLNPIPAQGFAAEEDVPYIRPEAKIYADGGCVTIEMNTAAMPRIRIDPEYRMMLESEKYSEAHPFLKTCLVRAREIIGCVENRTALLSTILNQIVQRQKDFFTTHGHLVPMTMTQISDELNLNVSTVSRAVKGKYILFDGKILALRSLFTCPLGTGSLEEISSAAIKQRIRMLIASEHQAKPLSDEAIAQSLVASGIDISRRTVAKYRAQLQIPAAPVRRRNSCV